MLDGQGEGEGEGEGCGWLVGFFFEWSKQEEEEEEEEEKDSQNFFLSWPPSSSTLAVACARLVFLVLFLALCSRRRYWQWYVLAGFAGYVTPRAVLFFPLVNVRGDSTGAVLGQVISLADEARGDSTGAALGQGVKPVVVPSGAFGETAQKTVEIPQLPFFDKLVQISVVVQRPIPMVVFRPEMLGIMAGMDQKDLFGMCKAWFAGF